jgi:Raf kinase inhibitor-like YbhB/YbcL family protein
MLRQLVALSLLATTALIGCSKSQPAPANVAAQPAQQPQTGMKVESAAFKEGQPIPRQYTCDGINISPPLEWSGVPKSAKTIAIVADDPDAPGGTWVHWVLYNLPAENIGLVENVPVNEELRAGGFQGKNDFGKPGYGGPCPPSGTHRYFFKVYALDTDLPLKAGATRADVDKAIQGHIVAQAQLMGTYQRGR